MAASLQSTGQLREKLQNFPGPSRHKVNSAYYGGKKISGKRKERSLKSAEKKLAERMTRTGSRRPTNSEADAAGR